VPVRLIGAGSGCCCTPATRSCRTDAPRWPDTSGSLAKAGSHVELDHHLEALIAALRAGALTADAVVLKAREAADTDTSDTTPTPAPDRAAEAAAPVIVADPAAARPAAVPLPDRSPR
jgi:hypothetical protein